jgi:isoleucyl-tRNA synthetase
MSRYEKLIKDPTLREKEILALWKEQETFAKSLCATQDGPRYVFYEGPPTANGKPHFGHLMPRVYKDLFPRYKTMQGFYVARKGGWDTHGLPVEIEVEKEIGVNSKPEIESYGVEKFVEHCKESVWKYKGEWERMIERMGFWIDLENAYVTYTDDYIESVWWELAQMFHRGLLYRGHKVLPYCPRCGTGLSSHEVAQGYRMVKDPSLSVRMRIVSGEDSHYKEDLPGKTSLLTWTTTPWTLPANVGLAIAANATYVEVEQNDERLILAKELLDQALEGDYRIVREIPGEDLIGLSYEPPYRLLDDERAYRVHAADFVNMEEGTGIVHTAPAFGEDDYLLGQEKNLPFFHPVDLSGKFTEEFPLCVGTFVKQADPKIIEDLKERGLLYRFAPYEHDYPFCWRCGTPLLYYAMDSWYIKTTAVKEELIANNRAINWYPAHIGEGRLGDFLLNLKDWALSRDRYWGTPLNLWVCDVCEETIAVGSREELVERARDKELARTVEFHRPYIDKVELTCPKCGKTMHRVSNVIDTWFDSGSMHTAQWHYPFENKEKFKESFPADFICEATDQTRGWFYTLLATSTIIHGEAPFRNCIVTGLGLDAEGFKMSKSKGNVIDPWELVDLYGADTLRWYFYSSSAPWKSKRLGKDAVKEPLYRFLDTLRNTYDFFALYASIDDFDPQVHRASEEDLSVLDRWVLSRLAATVKSVTDALDRYDVISATNTIEDFLDEVSNWYIRSSRRRFWKGGMGPDKIAAYTTLYRVLSDLSKVIAPFVPFISEAIYQRLRTPSDPESVHLCRYPQADPARIDADLDVEMSLARGIVSLGHQARHQAQVKVRQPLSRILVNCGDREGVHLSAEILALVKAELNVEEATLVPSLTPYFEEIPVPNFRTLGPRLGPQAQAAAAWIKEQAAVEIREALRLGSISARMDGKTVTIEPEDVSFEAVLPDGFVLVEEGGLHLLLDTTLDDALREKGLVREVIHRIQILRKEAGFEVTDRIALGYQADERFAAVIAKNRETIASEILALKMEPTLEGEHEFQKEILIDGLPITFGLSRI